MTRKDPHDRQIGIVIEDASVRAGQVKMCTGALYDNGVAFQRNTWKGVLVTISCQIQQIEEHVGSYTEKKKGGQLGKKKRQAMGFWEGAQGGKRVWRISEKKRKC